MILGLILAASFAAEALRDGLYEIAREEAATSTNALAVTLESYAREKRWQEVLDNAPTNDAPSSLSRYYRALASLELGEKERAASLLADTDFKPLKAALAAAEGREAEAAGYLAEIKDPSPAASLMLAELLAKTGERDRAESIWREMGRDAKLAEDFRAAAALDLGDVELLRKVYDEIVDAKLRSRVGLRLGVKELAGKTPETRAEGETLIRTIAHAAPDTDGAADAMVALADTLLAEEDYAAAEGTYRLVTETWPERLKSAHLAENLGWAQLQAGAYPAALESFERLESLTTNRDEKALALVKIGDVLSLSGRGEEAMERYRTIQNDYADTPAGKCIKGTVELRQREAEGREAYRAYRFEDARRAFEAVGHADATRRDQMDFFGVLCLYGLGLDVEAEKRARELMGRVRNRSLKAQIGYWLAKLDYNRGSWSAAARQFLAFAAAEPTHAEAPVALYWAAQADSAAADYASAISNVTSLLEKYPGAAVGPSARILQADALIELGRFDDALTVLNQVTAGTDVPEVDLKRARIRRADALFATGADNPENYRQALEEYRALWMKETSPSLRLELAYKIGSAYEKLGQLKDAYLQYYTEVILVYDREVRAGVVFSEEARTVFVRAAFHFADALEANSRTLEAKNILSLVVASGLPAGKVAEERLEKLNRKGKYL